MSDWHIIPRDLFDTLAELDPYLAGRWPYYRTAGSIVRNFAHHDKPALEIGPRRCALLQGVDANYLDIRAWGLPRTIVHDAENTPWPFARDRSYSVAVALQVLEHLRTPQTVLAEMLRVADLAVISIPYRWTDGPENHRDLGLNTVSEWIGDAGNLVIYSISAARLVVAIAPHDTGDTAP